MASLGRNIQAGPDFVAVADTDGDGRDELLRPTRFALRQCVFLPDPLAPPQEGNFFYFCPEGIRGNEPIPTPDAGFQFPPGSLDAMYSRGLGDWDFSLYYAGGSVFSADYSTNPPILKIAATPHSVITNRSGQGVIDVFGDSLPDSLLHYGCPLLGEACVVPTMLKDVNGARLTPGTVFVYENRGVLEAGSVSRPLARTPALPDLVWRVSALASTGHVDSAIRVARWSYDPLSSNAGRTSGPTLPPLYALPQGLPPPAGHFYFTSSMPVVATYWQSNGNVQSSACQSGGSCLSHGYTRTQYGYREALYSAEGRGFRGFRAITEQTDGLSPGATPVVTPGLRTTTVFKQTFPLSSSLLRIVPLAA